MAEFSGMKPTKGILKNTTGKKNESCMRSNKQTKWDEMNIIETLHPPGKDYGHMKVEEPKTPFRWGRGSDSEDEADGFDPNDLAKRLCQKASEPPKSSISRSDSEEEMEVETEDQRVKRRAFENKRKAHYNEFSAVKLARHLMEADDDWDTGPGEKRSYHDI